MAEMQIREESPEDVAGIRRVNEQAFGGDTEASLVDALRSSDGSILSLVAIDGGEVVGHLLFSPVVVRADEETFEAVGLGPMAVRPELQRRGIGSMLVRDGLDRLRQAGHEVVVVLGHAEYYPRFGFRRASELGIRWEHDAPDACFMVHELRPGSLRGRSGVVSYRPEFG
jgi:putative acetyltransferase